MRISRAKNAMAAFEYGCDLRRLYPWEGVAVPEWGSAIASVRPSEATDPHEHDEEETFIVLCGCGAMTVAAETEILEPFDVVYIERNLRHSFRNLSDDEPLVFLSIFWGKIVPDALSPPEPAASPVLLPEASEI